MANRFSTPILQFADNTGLPYAGGSLTFTASGTSTPLATYSNRALTIANTNPVVLDSAGRAGDIFLQNLAYKVVLADANSNVIWTEDPVYASDLSTTASFLSGAGSPNGVVAGSQGSPTVPASVYWDTTNNILYVCTTTGTTSTAVWTAVNASTAAAVVPSPQGYLTLTSGVPIITGDVTATTSVFYTTYVGNLVPIYNGSSFVPTVFTELSLSLVASHAASNIYDIFIFNNSGVPTLVTGPSWSAGTAGSITVGSCARGTGAGGTSLSRVNGIYTNAVQISARNGSTTFTINANLATYVGSIYMDSVNGQVSCYRSFGSARKWGIWNAYNRTPINLIGTTTTGSSYAVATFRPLNNDAANNAMYSFVGLGEETCLCTWYMTGTLPNPSSNVQIGIGVNSTTVSTSASSLWSSITATGYSGSLIVTPYATTTLQPGSLGVNKFVFLEYSSGGVNWNASAMNGTLGWRG